MVDTRDSKSRDSNIMRVQVPPSAQEETSLKWVGGKSYRKAIRLQSEIRSPFAARAKSHKSPQCMETVFPEIVGLEPID